VVARQGPREQLEGVMRCEGVLMLRGGRDGVALPQQPPFSFSPPLLRASHLCLPWGLAP